MVFRYFTRRRAIIGAAFGVIGFLAFPWISENLTILDTRELLFSPPGKISFNAPTPLGWWINEADPKNFIEFKLSQSKNCSVAQFVRKRIPDAIQVHFCGNESERSQQYAKLSWIFPWYLGYKKSLRSQDQLILQSKSNPQLGLIPPLVIANRSLTRAEKDNLFKVLSVGLAD
jgi:hypothetical protein